jgi:hypothetical protein
VAVVVVVAVVAKFTNLVTKTIRPHTAGAVVAVAVAAAAALVQQAVLLVTHMDHNLDQLPQAALEQLLQLVVVANLVLHLTLSIKVVLVELAAVGVQLARLVQVVLDQAIQ